MPSLPDHFGLCGGGEEEGDGGHGTTSKTALSEHNLFCVVLFCFVLKGAARGPLCRAAALYGGQRIAHTAMNERRIRCKHAPLSGPP